MSALRVPTTPRVHARRRSPVWPGALLAIGFAGACDRPDLPMETTLTAGAPSFATFKGPIRDDGMETVGAEDQQDFIQSSVPGVEWPLQYVSPACSFTPFVEGAEADVGQCRRVSWDSVANYSPAGGMVKGSVTGFVITQDHYRQLNSSGRSPGLNETSWTQQSLVVRRTGLERAYYVHTAGTWTIDLPYQMWATSDAVSTASFSATLADSSGQVIASQSLAASSLVDCSAIANSLPNKFVDTFIPDVFPADQQWSQVTKTSRSYPRCLRSQRARFSFEGGPRLGTWVTLRLVLDEANTGSTDKPVYVRYDHYLYHPARKITVQPTTISLSSTSVVSVYLHSDAVFNAAALADPLDSTPQGIDLGSVLLVVGADATGRPVGARIMTNSSGARSIAVGNFDGDGRPDLRMDFSVAELRAAGLEAGGGFQLGGLYLDLYRADGLKHHLEFYGRAAPAPKVVL